MQARSNEPSSAADLVEALRAQIKVGVDALDQGDFIELDKVELDGYLKDMSELIFTAPQP